MSGYLCIRRAEVRNANAQPAWWLVGPPGPLAFAGFAHALGRVAQERGEVTGVAIVHHDFELLADHVTLRPRRGDPPGATRRRRLVAHQFRGASLIDKKDYVDGHAPNLSLQPSVRGNMLASVVIRFDDEADVSVQVAREWLSQARVAGGAIVNSPAVTWHESLEEVMQEIKLGAALHERADLMQPQPGKDPLDLVLEATRPDRWQELPWVVATAVGFAAVTPLCERAFSRDAHLHAYVEPLVGLVQYRQLRDAPMPFWQYARPQERLFIVTTHPEKESQ